MHQHNLQHVLLPATCSITRGEARSFIPWCIINKPKHKKKRETKHEKLWVHYMHNMILIILSNKFK